MHPKIESETMDLIKTDLIVGNSISNLIGFFVILLISWGSGTLLRYSLRIKGKRMDPSRRIRRKLYSSMARSTVYVFVVIGLKIAFLALHLGPEDGLVYKFVDTFLALLFVSAIGLTAFNLVSVPMLYLHNLASKTDSKLDDMLVPVLRKSLRLTIVLFSIVQMAQILSNKPISSIIAGLGIGGLAVALAAQDTIKNFFGSLIIFSDKPFEFGERINYEGHDGTIEEVGLRSTRLRRLDGHQVTIPNGELANKSIHNIGRRPFIRRVLKISITYDTSPEKVKEGKEILESILKDHEGMDPNGEMLPRVYFSDFNDSSLGYLVLYWFFPPAYWDYMAFSEKVNLQILEQFNQANIDFAFPTQTVHLKSNEGLKSPSNDPKVPSFEA